MRHKCNVLGTEIDAVSWPAALQRVDQWARSRESKAIFFCNSHSVVTAKTDPRLKAALAAADFAAPDGAPVAWMMRMLGYGEQKRIDGPEFMRRICAAVSTWGGSVFLYGSTDTVLDQLSEKLRSEFPGLRIVGKYSPPFRNLSEQEQLAIASQINESGAHIVFVGLGCPKQEIWIHSQAQRISGVKLGVGAAFDYHAGSLKRAPIWMRQIGFEWLFRMMMEPRRLWRRYLRTNFAFILGARSQLLEFRRAKS